MKKLAIILLFLSFLFSNCLPHKRKAPEAIKGVLDLRYVGETRDLWDFENDGIVDLN